MIGARSTSRGQVTGRRQVTGRGDRSRHRVLGLALIIVALLSGCTIPVSGYARSGEAYVDPQGVYTLIVPPEWGEAAPLEAMPAAETWLLPAGSDGVRPTVLAVTYLVEDAAGMIDVLYSAQKEILGAETENGRINSVQLVTGSAGDLLGLLDFSQTLSGRQLRQLDVIAVIDIGSVVLSFIAPISTFDELLPEFESSALSMHTS